MNYRFTKQVSIILKDAAKEAKDMGNNYVGSEHVLLAILKDPTTSLSKMAAKQGVFYYQLKEDLMVLFGLKDKNIKEISVTQVVDDILAQAHQFMESSNAKSMNVDMLSLALLQTNSCVANEILARYDLQVEACIQELSQGETHELDRVSELRNLNTCQHNRGIVGRDSELDLMISILSRKEKANPLLIGEPGVGKTALVEKLASMVAEHKIPSLQGSCIYELHLNTLVAGTKYRGDFEEKLQNLIKLLEKYPNVILFIDEIHQMIGAGKSEGSIDVSSVLKPYLARGVIKCIGATTLDEYEKYIEKDRALERRFQVIMVKEPDQATCAKMLLSKIKEYENFHQVYISENTIHSIVSYCDYYMPQRKFPDKAIDVLDLACVRAKRKECHEVDEEVIRYVIEQLTDIPLTSQDRLPYVEEYVRKHVIGQEKVIEKLMKQLSWINQETITQRPLGVWFFLGDPSTGKKTMIKSFAYAYFHQEELIEFDMSYGQGMLESVCNKLRRNPYTTLYISNLHLAQAPLLQMLAQSIQKGYIELQDKKIDLRHTIVIISGDFKLQETSSLHFQSSTSSMKQLENEVGKEFLSIIDEFFMFESLGQNEQLHILENLISVRNIPVQKHVLMEAIHKNKSVEDAWKWLRTQAIHIG